MICIIRISGEVGIRKDIAETFNRLRLRKKYSCVVLNQSDESLGMIKKLRSFVAFGEINDETLGELIEKRGKLIDKTKKTDLKKIAGELKKGKKYEELNLKPFFRLHPPRGGIKSKVHFPKGVLGNNKEKINKLVERML
ncbi:MAG: uL30 family ribosomal protein [Nanoarchaeota archaeon]